MTTVKMPIALVASFLWIGFVCAISFLESWIKFKAPGITLPLGLGIGKLVFAALNRVEWVLAIAIIVNMAIVKRSLFTLGNILFFIPLVILVLQTFWLLPVLSDRADLHIQGQLVPPSNIHYYYVGIEFIKLIGLFIFGISLFNKSTT